jgi:hypothetical protein
LSAPIVDQYPKNPTRKSRIQKAIRKKPRKTKKPKYSPMAFLHLTANIVELTK